MAKKTKQTGEILEVMKNPESEPAIEMSSVSMCLSTDELRNLEKADEHENNKLRDITELELRATVLKLEYEKMNMALQLKQLEFERMATKLSEVRDVLSNLKIKNAEYRKQLGEKFGITGNWGYNPDTGEVSKS